jgi:hypothetical protein
VLQQILTAEPAATATITELPTDSALGSTSRPTFVVADKARWRRRRRGR